MSKYGAGAGVYIENLNIRLSHTLGQTPSVVQAEIFAVLSATHQLIDLGLEHLSIGIFVDSKCCLQILHSAVFTSQLALDCCASLNLLAQRNRVWLQWVPGHSGIPGNVTADKLAKAGACRHFMGPEPSLPVDYKVIKSGLEQWTQEEHCKY